VSQSPVCLPLYCRIAIENIWLAGHISNHFIENRRKREDINKHACWLLSDSKLLDNMAINFGCTPAKPIGNLALAHGVT